MDGLSFLEDDLKDLTECLVDLFDDFCWIHSANLHNREQKEDDWSDSRVIYGQQRSDLYDSIMALLSSW